MISADLAPTDWHNDRMIISVTAASWHMARWIGAAFLGMAVVSQAIFFASVASTGGKTTWSTPAGETERERD